MNPDTSTRAANLGNLFKAQGKHGEAGAMYRKAMELNPGGAIAQFDIGTLLKGPCQARRGRGHEPQASDFGSTSAHIDLGAFFAGRGKHG